MVSFAWLFFLLFKTRSNIVTLCSLKRKQEEVELLATARGLALSVSSMRRRSRKVVGRRRVVSSRFCFLFFIHNSCLLLFLRTAVRAHGEARHARSGRGHAPAWREEVVAPLVRGGRGCTPRLPRRPPAGTDRPRVATGGGMGGGAVVCGDSHLICALLFLRAVVHAHSELHR